MGAIEMMELETVDAVDAVVLAPAVGRRGPSAAHEAMQHGQERRALEREFDRLLAPARPSITARQPRLLPQPLEGQGRPDPSRRARKDVASPAASGVEDDGLVGETRTRSQQTLQLTAFA